MAEPRIIERSEWGPRYRTGWPDYAAGTPYRPLPATECFVHYPGAKAPPGPDATLAEDIAYILYLEEIGYTRFRTGTGWGNDAKGTYGAGISYSLLFAKSGRIFRGHDSGRCSSHTAGHNVTGMGYCVLISDGEAANDAQLDAVAWALQEQVRRGQLAKAHVTGGHRDVVATTCPTDVLYAQIPDINARTGGTPVAKPAPTRTQLKEFVQWWKSLGGEIYCSPYDWEAGVCRPGNHGHSADSMHFKGLAVDFGWPGAAISAQEALAVIVGIRRIDAVKNYDTRWRFNVGSTDHPDHGHGDAGEYNGPGWYDDVRDRGSILARDGVNLFLPTTFYWHVPPMNLDFPIGKIAAWQSKMKRAIRKSTGKPYYSGRVDGYHGDGSKGGTRDFQSDFALVPDAKPGDKTLTAMNTLLTAVPEVSLVQKRYDAIVAMVTGSGQIVQSYVLAVQKMLLAAGYDPKGLDGSPGEGFQVALGRFQKDHRLTVDYLPGKGTWDALVAATTPAMPKPVGPVVIKPAPAPTPAPTPAPVAPYVPAIKVTELAGADRYATAALVADQASGAFLFGKVYLAASGTDDHGAPDGITLLAAHKGTTLPAATRNALQARRTTELVILGGLATIPQPQRDAAIRAADTPR